MDPMTVCEDKLEMYLLKINDYGGFITIEREEWYQKLKDGDSIAKFLNDGSIIVELKHKGLVHIKNKTDKDNLIVV